MMIRKEEKTRIPLPSATSINKLPMPSYTMPKSNFYTQFCSGAKGGIVHTVACVNNKGVYKKQKRCIQFGEEIIYIIWIAIVYSISSSLN